MIKITLFCTTATVRRSRALASNYRPFSQRYYARSRGRLPQWGLGLLLLPSLAISGSKTSSNSNIDQGRGTVMPRVFSTTCIQHGGRRNRNDGRRTNPRLELRPGPEPEITTKTRVFPQSPHENIYTIPNMLTFSRLALTPVIGYLVVEGSHPGLALSLFCYAGVTDLVDGWIARKFELSTVVGSVIDPMADKALMTVLTIALAAKGALPVWLAIIILGRDAGLGISAIYYRWISLPPPKTFVRYWDFSLPSAEVRPTTISKYNTFLQLALVGLTTAQPIIEPWSGLYIGGFLGFFQYVVAMTTVWSGASYVFNKNAVRILDKRL